MMRTNEKRNKINERLRGEGILLSKLVIHRRTYPLLIDLIRRIIGQSTNPRH